MYKLAVVGDRDSILVFKALGIDVFPAVDGKEAGERIDYLAKNDYGVIFLTEELSLEIPEIIDKYREEIIPAIILIPSNKGSMNIGMEDINKSVEKAIGANIL